MKKIAKSVIDVVSEVLGWHYTHSHLEALFKEAGAPGEAPIGNKVDKCSGWMRMVNSDPNVDPLMILGKLLEHYMDYEIPTSHFNINQWLENRERIKRAMSRNELGYEFGGFVRDIGARTPAQSLNRILKAKDLASVEEEFERLEAACTEDPRGALTSACALLEALFKICIEDEGLEMPKDQTIKPLWSIVSKGLGLDPASLPDDDLKRILSGLTSIVDGLGALRTHAGSAHGRGRTRYRPEPRHARMATNAACTLATFVLETWEVRRPHVRL
jgi:hypothetical protein